MRVLLLNQAFYPDYAATALQLSDFACGLVQAGHDVTVICSQRGYADPSLKYLKYEKWNGVKIYRIPTTCFGKNYKISRALDFFSFILCCCFRMLFLKRFEAVVALTSPPLISFIASIYCRIFNAKFYYWVMDLNPDEAVAAGWLKENSLICRFLEFLSRYSFQTAEKVIALDHFMANRITTKGISSDKIEIIPPWSHDDEVSYDNQAGEQFRKEHNLENKFLVLYAGNHSPCHPLTTVIEAARVLKENKKIVFLFVGGGSEHRKVKEFAKIHNLKNILCLPYQATEKLSGLLSAADLHVVIMGEPFVGIIHPCKIYNILHIGGSVLYIGPEKSHIVELNNKYSSEMKYFALKHGEVKKLVQLLQNFSAAEVSTKKDNLQKINDFKISFLMPKLMALLN